MNHLRDKIMQIMWTPWRMPFIRGARAAECIFCSKTREQQDRDNLILYRGSHAFIILNAYPYSTGHLMVVPYTHAASLEEMDGDTCSEIMNLMQRSISALRRAMAPQGFNVGMNIGQAAGAGIADHLHLHIVPRWTGDTSFMPVVAKVRLLPEILTTTYDNLIAAGIGAD